MLDEKREHELKLPGVKLADDMTITGDLETAIREKDFLVLAVPSPFTRATAQKMKPYVADGQIIVDVAKGIEESTLMTLSPSDRGRNPSGRRGGPLRTEPCGGSRAQAANHLCYWRKDTENG